MGCDCTRVPESFGEPLPRWSILPDDPPDLRRWLQHRAAADGEPTGDTTEIPWPEEEAS